MSTHALGQLKLANILQTSALRFDQKEAIYCHTSNRRFTFRALEERANRLANTLLDKGYQAGDVVAMLCSNRVELVDWYFCPGPYRHHRHSTQLPPCRRRNGRFGQRHAGQGPDFESRFNEQAREIRKHASGLDDVLSFGSHRDPDTQDYNALLSASSPLSPGLSIDEKNPYYYNLTSGTHPACRSLTPLAITIMQSVPSKW